MADTLIEKGNPISGDLMAEVRACRRVDQPMLVFGAPGVGKSDQIRGAADEDDLVIDLRLNSLEAIDMRGLPIIRKDVLSSFLARVGSRWVVASTRRGLCSLTRSTRPSLRSRTRRCSWCWIVGLASMSCRVRGTSVLRRIVRRIGLTPILCRRLFWIGSPSMTTRRRMVIGLRGR